MKIRPLTLILLTLLLFAGALSYVSNGPGPLVNEIVVRKLDAQLPVKEEEIWGFLWTQFANKPEEEKFAKLTTEGWQARFHEYEKILVKKAKRKSLDGDSLEKCLTEIFDSPKDELAYLPVGAYSTVQGTNPVWIVVVKWEISGPINDGQYLELGHVRMFAFDARNFKQIGFCTCM